MKPGLQTTRVAAAPGDRVDPKVQGSFPCTANRQTSNLKPFKPKWNNKRILDDFGICWIGVVFFYLFISRVLIRGSILFIPSMSGESISGNLRNHKSPKTGIINHYKSPSPKTWESHFVTDLSPRPAVANPFWSGNYSYQVVGRLSCHASGDVQREPYIFFLKICFKKL